MTKKGEIVNLKGDWDIKPEEEAQLNFGDLQFKTLDVGDNVVRFIGNYIFRNVHYVPTARRKYIICCGENCPLCMKGDTPRLSYYCNIYDRSDGKMKILRFGSRMRKALYNLYRRYGDLSAFDVIITREGTGLETVYTVFPIPPQENKPLTEKEVQYIKDNFIQLEDYFKIPSPEEILSLISNNVTDSEATEINQAAPSIRTLSSVMKSPEEMTCFGKSYNPISPKCKECALSSSCKQILMKNLNI